MTIFNVVFADKDRELGEAQAQIKALKLSERAREKAVEEVNFCYTEYSTVSYIHK